MVKPDNPVQFPYRDAQRISRVVQRVEREKPETVPLIAGQDQEPSLIVMLMEDLDSGQTAKAAVLRRSLNDNYLLTVYGRRDEEATFDLTWNEETVLDIDFDSTPVQLRNRLLEFSFVRPQDLAVQFGRETRSVNGVDQDYDTYRWIVVLREGFPDYGDMQVSENASLSWIGSERTVMQDSGRMIDVRSLLPVGLNIENNTPMKAGAIAIVSSIDGFGWVVDAVEARHLLGSSSSDSTTTTDGSTTTTSGTTTTGSGGTTTTGSGGTTTGSGGTTTTTPPPTTTTGA